MYTILIQLRNIRFVIKMTGLVVPARFSQEDVKNMDNLIGRGVFISRSDLIQKAAREAIEKERKRMSNKDSYVKFMKETGTFEDPELKLVAEMLIQRATSKEKAIPNEKFSDPEKKLLNKLLKDPFQPVGLSKKAFYLTKNGIDEAEGFLEGLLHLKKRSS